MLYANSHGTFQLEYPNIEILGQQIFIAENVYNVTLKPNSTIIEDFDAVLLHIFLVHRNLETTYLWEQEVFVSQKDI